MTIDQSTVGNTLAIRTKSGELIRGKVVGVTSTTVSLAAKDGNVQVLDLDTVRNVV